MSRSRRKTPICGMTTARSEKEDKAIAHGKARAKTRLAILLQDDDRLPHPKEFGNPWSTAKDGKQYFGSKHKKLMRK